MFNLGKSKEISSKKHTTQQDPDLMFDHNNWTNKHKEF